MPHDAPVATACRRLNYADTHPEGERLASEWPAEPVRQGRTADFGRAFLFDDGSIRLGRRVVAKARPMHLALALFNVVDRFRADELAGAAALLGDVESLHEEGGRVGLPHDTLLELAGKAPAQIPAAAGARKGGGGPPARKAAPDLTPSDRLP